MQQSPVSMPLPTLKLAQTFFEAVGPSPWEVSAGGVLHQFTPKNLDKLIRLSEAMRERKQPIYAILPAKDGMTHHFAARVPFSKQIASLPPAQITIIADDRIMVWSLAEAIPLAAANKLATEYARKVGGEPITGQGVLLPGTHTWRGIAQGLARSYAVQMLPPSKTRYSLMGGRLASRREPAKAVDPRALSVHIGESSSGDCVDWRPSEQSNGFFIILGASGSGKTVALRKIGSGIQEYGVPILVLDFHGDVTIPGVRDILLSSGTDSTRGLNPLEIDAVSGREAGLFDQRGELCEMIRRACPALGHRQSNILRKVVEQAYLQAGIRDNDPATWSATPPTFPDLIRLLDLMAEEEGANRNAIEGVIASASDLFGHPIFGRDNHLGIDDLLGQSTRLDLSKLSDGVRFVATESLLQRIFRVLRNRGPIPVHPVDDSERYRLFVMIDEAKILSMGGGRNILDSLMLEGRKFGLGLVLASQMAAHFSNDVRGQCATWLILKPQDIAEAKVNAPNIDVDPEQIKALKGKGDGFYRSQATGAAWRIQVKGI